MTEKETIQKKKNGHNRETQAGTTEKHRLAQKRNIGGHSTL